MREIKLSHLDEVLRDLSYPVTQEEIEAELGEVRVLLADGEAPLSELMDGVETDVDEWETVGDLEMDLYASLPKEALGEPGQSEGDA